MSLEGALDALVASEPFERLLLERARPILAHAEAGEDALLAGLARALDTVVMAVDAGAPGGRGAGLGRGRLSGRGPRGAAAGVGGPSL